jgi:hypothetical protein
MYLGKLDIEKHVDKHLVVQIKTLRVTQVKRTQKKQKVPGGRDPGVQGPTNSGWQRPDWNWGSFKSET